MPDADLESLPGVGPATADKLHEAGFDSFQSLAVASPSELSNTADVREAAAAGIGRAA
ncbi:helix-hairpin-helix domain-containing protein, partial [Natronococcus sp. JC468]|uniref:helix-hairpin-helix domain-containing protein n=1 Tax=Natronococcus sp. JC468 TaxID=1961921 RepID=UPI001FD74A89